MQASAGQALRAALLLLLAAHQFERLRAERPRCLCRCCQAIATTVSCRGGWRRSRISDARPRTGACGWRWGVGRAVEEPAPAQAGRSLGDVRMVAALPTRRTAVQARDLECLRPPAFCRWPHTAFHDLKAIRAEGRQKAFGVLDRKAAVRRVGEQYSASFFRAGCRRRRPDSLEPVSPGL